MSNKNLCDNCKFLVGPSTNNCQPTDYDELGNVHKCDTYREKNIIRCIVNFICRNKTD